MIYLTKIKNEKLTAIVKMANAEMSDAKDFIKNIKSWEEDSIYDLKDIAPAYIADEEKLKEMETILSEYQQIYEEFHQYKLYKESHEKLRAIETTLKFMKENLREQV